MGSGELKIKLKYFVTIRHSIRLGKSMFIIKNGKSN